MKQILLFSIFFLTWSTCFSQQNVASYDSTVYRYMRQNNITNYRLFRSNNSITFGAEIKTFTGSVKCPLNNCWCYFIDEQPNANWGHKCRFVFIRKSDNYTSDIQYNMPPSNLQEWSLLTKNKTDYTLCEFISINPNPATDNVQISLLSPNTTSSDETLISTKNYSVEVLDLSGLPVYTTSKNTGKFTIPVSSFLNGLYTIIVSDGSKVYQKKLLVKH